jgi:pimeloyl-ACP methyl ester carboxylesterase
MVIVLVHPFPFDSRYWDPQRSQATPDVEWTAPDLPGFGNARDQTAAGMNDFADALDTTLADIGPFVLCGLSLGGYVALAWWRRHRARRPVAGLILADTKVEADTAEGKAGRDASARLVRDQGVEALADQLLPRLLARSTAPAIRARAREVMISQQAPAVIAALMAMRDRPSSADLLPSVDVPVLAISGTEDAITPPGGLERLARNVPDGRFVALPGAGHLSSLEQALAFNSAVADFVRGLRRAAG